MTESLSERDVAKEAKTAEGNDTEILYTGDGQFVLKGQWMGHAIDVAEKYGYSVDTVNAMGERGEIRFSKDD